MPSPMKCVLVALTSAALSFSSLSASANEAGTVLVPGAAASQDPKAIALQAWQEYLQSIGWPKPMSEQHAPRFLGVQKERVANEHGGFTVTFDGSRPGVRATVVVVLDASGKLVGKPVVQLADVLEAR